MNNRLTIIILAIVFAAGCVRAEQVKTADIDPSGWRMDDPVRLEIENSDTLSRRGLKFLFRFDNTFPLQSIPLTIRVSTPDTLWYEETFAALPANPVRANNDFYEAAVPYRNDVIFPRMGRYVFEIANAETETKGLWGLGIIIE